VQVRVQHGATMPANADNVHNTIFGYGLSAINSNTHFTYGTAPGNLPPTVAQAASAALNPQGTAAALAVLGADDGGEANLIYTWSVVSKPAGAPNPVFQLNGSNAAKNTVAVLAMAGSYTFRVTIRDVQGLTTTSDVSVSATARLSSIRVTPKAPRVRAATARRFTAWALDQFGALLDVQPAFTWKLKGLGALGPKGNYVAPTRPGGPYTIIARAGGMQGLAKVWVV
jgi:hypothetical protein